MLNKKKSNNKNNFSINRKQAIVEYMMSHWKVVESDFLGFLIFDEYKTFKNTLSYHHTRIANCKGGDVSVYNGSILCRETSHDYIHIIQRFDPDMFKYLTSILIEVNDQGYLPNSEQLIKINEALKSFEREYSGERTRNHNLLIKDSYVRRLKR